METKNTYLGGTAMELRNRINNCTTPEQLNRCQQMRINWIKALTPSEEARKTINKYFDQKAEEVGYKDFLSKLHN